MVLNFSACASVRAMVVTNADNTIDEIVTINLNAEEIFALGKTVKEVQDYVYNLSYNEADKMCESLHNKTIISNKLPFPIESKKVKFEVTEPENTLLPTDMYDDTVDEQLLSMMGK